MSILFNEVNTWYEVADAPGLVLPSGEAAWSLGLWVNVAENAGASFQYAVSQGPFGGNSLHLYLTEGATGRWYARLADAADRVIQMITADYGDDGVSRLLVVQDLGPPGAVKQLWSCPAGGEAVLESQTALKLDVVDAGGPLNLGRRADGQAARYFGNTLGEFWKGDFALSEGEIEALAAGASILDIGKTPDIYLPMVSAAPVISDESGNGLDATRFGSPATVTPHFITPGGSGGALAVKSGLLQRLFRG